MSEEYFTGHYEEWRDKRLKAIVAYYGKDFFSGKSLLEVGCGRAHVGKYFYDLGAAVTVCDGRKEHIDYVRNNLPGIKTFVMDMEFEFPEGFFDVIIDMGLIYHLKDHTYHFNKICTSCKWLILETEVVDSLNPLSFFASTEHSTQYDQSLSGVGKRPSIGGVETTLDFHGMSFYRIDDDRCNSSVHKYDWLPAGTEKYVPGHRKLWFCEKKEEQEKEAL